MGIWTLFWIVVIAYVIYTVVGRPRRSDVPGTEALEGEVQRLQEEVDRLGREVQRLLEEQSFMVRMLSEGERPVEDADDDRPGRAIEPPQRERS